MKTKNNFYKANFLVEKRDDVHTIMVKIQPVKSIVDYISQIPNDVIYDDESKDYGKIKPENLHITVLYGINKDEENRVKKSLVNIPPNISATLGEVTMFECEKYDVLKIDVVSSHLSKINKFLCRNFDYTNDYDDYKPHVTLCYVKKGMGKNYIGDKRFNGLNYNFSIFIYSNENWDETNIKMQDEKAIHEIEKIDENLKKWFSQKWVRLGADGKIRGDCARGSDSEGKPKCLPKSKAQSMSKKKRASSAAKKRREDPDPNRRGAAKNVATKVKEEKINEKCWDGYRKDGTKKMFGKTVPNCVKNNKSNENIEENNPRIPRKPGQPANSKKHSDLYTDENPKNTITGLKFATIKDAEASVAKIRNSDRSHAHKIQAAVAMEQRAKVMGKISAAAVYRKYINANKKTDEGVPFNKCPHCGGPIVHISMLNEKQDACYHKVKSRYKIWPSAYASGALVQCRKKGAKNWGNKSENKNTKKELQNEVSLGLGGGYGGHSGGAISARGWAGTFTSPMTSTRLGNYPLKMVHRDKGGTSNTIANMDPYDSVNDKDLEHPVFKPDEIRSGVRYEMARMEYPSKDIAKQIVLANLKKDSRYYSELRQYFNTQKNESKLIDPKAGLTDDMIGRWTIKAYTEEHRLKNIKAENINMKTTPEQEMKIGIQVEMMDIEDELLATKIANDNLTADSQHYSKLIASGLVIDKNTLNKIVGHPEQKSATTPNTVSISATPRKHPEASLTTRDSLINRTTGSAMPNTVKIDMGTVPMAGATQPVSPDVTSNEADPTDFYLSKMRGVC